MAAKRDEAGFTLAEAAAAIAVLSVIAGLVAAFASGGLRSVERSRSASEMAAVLLRTEAALREAAAEVRIPYWERRAAIRVAEGQVEVPYFQGEADSFLRLDWDGRRLAIAGGAAAGDDGRSSGGRSAVRFPVAVRGVETFRAPGGEPRGLVVELEVRGRRCAIAASFGQGPLGLGRE
jgi:hypothetical protein